MEKIKYRLKEARLMKGVSLQTAADAFGFSRQYLNKIELNGCNLDSEQLIKFANFYGVKIDYLIPNPHRPKVELANIKFFCKSKF